MCVVCVCVCVCVCCVCVCMCVCMCVCVCVYVHVCLYMCLYMCVCLCMDAYFMYVLSLILQIWTLSDTDCDGALTISEFSIAIHLIGRCRGGEPVPSVLPPALKIAASSISSSPLPVRREVHCSTYVCTYVRTCGVYAHIWYSFCMYVRICSFSGMYVCT